MKRLLLAASLALVGVTTCGVAEAKGCISGAAVGGVAGHVAGHHAVLGAAAGCVINHHRNTVKDRQAAAQAKAAQAQAAQAQPQPALPPAH